MKTRPVRAPFGEEPADKAEDPNTPPDELGNRPCTELRCSTLHRERAPDTFDPKHPTTTFDGFMSAMSNQVATGVLRVPK